MKTFPWQKVILAILFLLILWFYFTGIPSVPFHPDESTQIFMSSDVSISTDMLAFVPGNKTGDRWRLRLIDSPLSRTMMGWALKINNMKSNPADWNWSADWQTNIASGAMPADNTLYTARWSVAWVFPFTCLFLYLLAKKINGKSTAVIAVLLMTTNALVLIHTRRAMSESVLLCTTTALIWLIIDFKNRPWLTAILSGLAVNAKQTAIPLMALAGVEIFLLPNTVSLSKKVRNILVFFTIILGISWSLNPAYWRYPTEAIREGLSQRQELTTKMRADYHTSKNPLEQMIFLIAQVFIQPPAAYDVMNYAEDTDSAVDAYLSQPYNTLFRGFSGGAVFLILSILGWIILWRQSRKNSRDRQLSFLILNLILLVFILMLMFASAAPFQRYYIILVPVLSIYQATAVVFLWNSLSRGIKKWTASSSSPLES